MKLIGNTKSKMAKNKSGENVPHLEIVELVLVHGNTVNNALLKTNIPGLHQEFCLYFKSTN